MTHHDLLIDAIQETLHTWYVTGQIDSQFDADKAKQDAQKLLTIVEEFQEKRSQLENSVLYSQWRASD